MKRIYTLTLVLLMAVGARAQLFMINAFTGTTFFGSYGVTVTSTGAACTGGGSTCFAPIADQYWIACGSIPGSYTYTFSRPVYHVGVKLWGVNGGPLGAGEFMRIYINGSPYYLTSADVASYTECLPSTPGGPMYLSGGTIMGPLGPVTYYNGADLDITYCPGITSLKCFDTGTIGGVALYGIAYAVQIDTSAVPCFRAIANSPCIGDTLYIDAMGDSTGATYSWTGPGSFTSTQQGFYFYPSTWADTGIYRAIRTQGSVIDTSYVHVTIHPLPIVVAANNSPLCSGLLDTLHLTDTAYVTGETFHWTGPLGFTSTLQNPNINGFTTPDTGLYKVVVTTSFGCKDSATTYVTVVPPPPPDTIVGPATYCQGSLFVPFVVHGVLPGATVLWYGSGTGGTPSTTPPAINTSIPGITTVWSSQLIGACESPRSSFTVQVIHTPPAPLVTGITQYCQYIGPYDSLTAHHFSGTDVFRWYTVAAGGTPLSAQPIPNISTAGVYQYWVSLLDSGCEGPRTPVTITVHPKPAPPSVTPQNYCQYWVPGNLLVNYDGTDPPETFQFYGPGVVTPGTSINPYPPTSVAPDTLIYHITETTVYGCVSDSATDKIIIKYKPDVPVTKNDRYCQHDQNIRPLNYLVDSAWNADSLSWYQATVPVPRTPKPVTDAPPGYTTWYVSQWVNGCQSDSGRVTVQVVYKPVFDIKASSPWVCEYDSIQLSYNALGQNLFEPQYFWTVPAGSILVNSTNTEDSTITLKFDTSNQTNRLYTVKLRAADDSDFCYSDTSIDIKVIPLPTMMAFTTPNVCLNDTVQLALSTRSDNANTFSWFVDNQTLMGSGAVTMVSSNSNSGGPFEISWIDTGRHVIKVTSLTQEGCQSRPTYDSVDVHSVPDATFTVAPGSAISSLCIDDSVLFNANTSNYSYSYEWSPSQYFNNENKPNAWGRLRDATSTITLKVTNPWGCYSSQSLVLTPSGCCTLLFPNAFAPNVVGTGTDADRVFQPISTGNHTYHMFRIVNRWGQTVFQSASSKDAKWDGTMNGVPQDMGTYYYYIKYDCGGETFEQKGDVTLIR